jgi:hypothetical protein
MSEAQPPAAALRFSAWIVLPFKILVQKGFPVKYRMLTQKTRRGFFFWFELCPMPLLIFFTAQLFFIF